MSNSSQAAMVLPDTSTLQHGKKSIITDLPFDGLGLQSVTEHLEQDLKPAFSGSSKSAHYYGFVTGGATPAANFADHLVVDADQNVQVHLPHETIATDVEAAALRMLCQLLDLDTADWPHRTFTTGATASNVLGLACGRQGVIAADVAEVGLSRAMQASGLEEIQVLTTASHSSLKKAASLVGIGRASVIDVSLKDAPHKFDMALLEQHLGKEKTATIVGVSCAEVNTGFFATTGQEMGVIRKFCDQYHAWIHIDAAFGAMARVLPDSAEFEHVRAGVAGLELADSITGDVHKLLNVPYDCGFFFSKSLDNATAVFKNPNAAYLSSSAPSAIPSPLHIGIENSRRFRALPVYGTLTAYGRSGYRDMLQRQISLARAVAGYIDKHDHLKLLAGSNSNTQNIFIIVLFRASDDHLNQVLVQRINHSRRIYVSGTSWNGQPAARFAIANWQVNVKRDLELIKEVLETVVLERDSNDSNI